MKSLTVYRLQLFAAAALMSTGGAAIKSAELTGWQIASFRSGIAAVALLALVPSTRSGWSWRLTGIGVPYAACLILFVIANKLTTAANTIFLQSSAPLYVLLLSPWLLKERIRPRDLLFIGAVIGGLVLFFVGVESPGGSAPDPVTGNVLAIGSGVCWALTVVGLRWIGAGRDGGGAGLTAVAIGNIVACLSILPLALPATVGGGDWLLLGYLGVFQIALAYVFLTSALRHVPAVEAAGLLLLEPALNPIWAFLVHGEVPGRWAVLGGAVILGAALTQAVAGARAPLERAAPD